MKTNRKWLQLFAVLLSFSLLAAACSSDTETETETEEGAEGSTEEAASSDDPVVVCELAYYTGEFAAFGPQLTADVQFPIEEVINQDPPLGRTWELVSEDLGEPGEPQAARACLDVHDADVIISIAHGYRTYRDSMIEHWAENDGPIVPSVHGGAIPGNLGGSGAEPIFRAQGLDEGLGTSGILYADSIGASSAVIFATEVEGFQLAANAAEAAAGVVGIEVLDRIDAPAGEPSYRAQVEAIADLNPDVVILQVGNVEAGTIIKQASEAGLSLNWIGETGLAQDEFLATLGEGVIETQQGVGYAAFAANTDTAAWEFFSEAWNGTEGYGDVFGDANDAYHFSAYDVMVHTALAVEAAGSLNASEWAPAMNAVGSAPGTVCYTYAECLELIRAGEDVDYEGVTGSADYTAGGVNSVTAAYIPFNADGSEGDAVILDAARGLEIVEGIATQAECDDNNVCTW